jgi:hypothetical protein
MDCILVVYIQYVNPLLLYVCTYKAAAGHFEVGSFETAIKPVPFFLKIWTQAFVGRRKSFGKKLEASSKYCVIFHENAPLDGSPRRICLHWATPY